MTTTAALPVFKVSGVDHCRDLLDCFQAVMHFASKDKARPLLNGVRIVTDNDSVHLWATDSYRAAHIQYLLIDGPVPELDLVVSLDLLKSALPKKPAKTAGVAELFFEAASNHLTIRDVNGSTTVPIMEGQFPNIDKLVADAIVDCSKSHAVEKFGVNPVLMHDIFAGFKKFPYSTDLNDNGCVRISPASTDLKPFHMYTYGPGCSMDAILMPVRIH